jgi:hypothetical protein
LNRTSQGEPVLSEVEGTPEGARKDFLICGRSRPFMKYPGLVSGEGELKNYGQVFA